MNRSWLVQRLNQPVKRSTWGQDNPFAFGGGKKNGGISDEAMSLIRGIFSFDYMGAAEFEFGAVPEALALVARQSSRFVATQFTIPLAKVERHWKTPKDAPAPTGEGTIYLLCLVDDVAEARERITGWAAGDGPRLKERTNLAYALNPIDEWDERCVGWFELNNGFFFFTDRNMWEGTARKFGVHVPQSEVAAS